MFFVLLLVLLCSAQGLTIVNIVMLVKMSRTRRVADALDCFPNERFYMPPSDGKDSPDKVDNFHRCLVVDGSFHAVMTGGILAAEHFNNRDGTFVSSFANLTYCDKIFKVTVLDTGTSSQHAVEKVLNELMRGNAGTPSLFIGPSTSSESIPCALIGGTLDVPFISYRATSDKLSDDLQYGRFMRTIPSDRTLAASLCSFWKRNGWSKAAIIFIDDEYGVAYKENVVEECKLIGFQSLVAAPFLYSDTKEAIAAKVKAMGEPKFNVFLVVLASGGFADIMEAAYAQDLLRSGTAWFISDGVTDDQFLQLSPAVRRASSGLLRVISAGGTMENPAFVKFKNAWSSFNSSLIDSYLPSYFSTPVGFFEDFPGDSSMVKDAATFMYDAVAAAGLLSCAIQPVGELQRQFGTQFYGAKNKLSFGGLTGTVQFSSNGDRTLSTTTHELQSIVFDTSGDISTQSLGYATDGQWKTTLPVTFVGNFAGPVFDRDVTEADMSLTSWTVRAVCMLMFMVNVTLAACFMLWTVMNRSHAVVRASQVRFLLFVATGVICSSSAIVPITFDDRLAPVGYYLNLTHSITLDYMTYDPASVACRMAIVMYSLGFVLTYSSLTCKIYLVKCIFKNKTLRKTHVSKGTLLAVVSACLVIDMTLVATWFAIAPIEYRREVVLRDEFGYPVVTVGRCMSDMSTVFLTSLALIHLSLLSIAAVWAFQSRNISTDFSEGKFVGVAIVAYLEVMLIALPVLVLVSENSTASVFLRSAVIFFNDLTVLLLIFVPKIVAKRSGKRESINHMITGMSVQHVNNPLVRISSESAQNPCVQPTNGSAHGGKEYNSDTQEMVLCNQNGDDGQRRHTSGDDCEFSTSAEPDEEEVQNEARRLATC